MSNQNKIIVTTLLIVGAIAERLWFDMGPNVELITFATFAASFYLGKKFALLLPLLILGITDVALGNSSILVFTWSAYAIIALGSVFFSRFGKTPFLRVSAATTGGAIASIWFFLWTNFGVWLLDQWGMYTNDAAGLLASYINGLPFLRNQLLGNVIIFSLGFSAFEALKLRSKKLFYAYR